jgi:hypothetical protein
MRGVMIYRYWPRRAIDASGSFPSLWLCVFV